MSKGSPGRVLLVDDEEVIRDLVSTHLTEQGWVCETACDGRAALDLARRSEFDVVLTDVRMPGLDGLGLSRELHMTMPGLPVIVVTAVASFDSAVRALKHGAFDYIVKPFQLETLDAALERALAHRQPPDNPSCSNSTTAMIESVFERRNEEQTKRLIRKTRRLRASNDRLRGSFEQMARVWVDTLEARRLEPRDHCRRVRAYSVLTGRQLGLSSSEMHDVSIGALLHHVGLLFLPERIARARKLLKPEHQKLLQSHTIIGHQMLRDVPLLAGAAQVIAAHHEHFDGSGSPRGLSGDEIPIGARCFAVAEAADAVIQRHPVVSGAALGAVARELKDGAGTLFDPEVVAAFLRVQRRDLERERGRFPGSAVVGPTTGPITIEPVTTAPAEPACAAIRPAPRTGPRSEPVQQAQA